MSDSVGNVCMAKIGLPMFSYVCGYRACRRDASVVFTWWHRHRGQFKFAIRARCRAHARDFEDRRAKHNTPIFETPQLAKALGVA